jgi:molybdenum cofactor synthesis domain-containing protein
VSVPELRASIVVIGDELLGGFVADSNSHWLSTRLRDNAVPLDRVHVVPDEFDAIDEALSMELARARPRIVVTTGGIGSTPDDITFEAVAASLGRGVELAPSMTQRLEASLAWTRSQGIELDDEAADQFLRMGRVPVGAELLQSDEWAPAVRVDVDGGLDVDGGATIVVLPGVPSLMRRLVTGAVEPLLLAGRNEPWTTVELHHGYPESLLNPAFLEIAREHEQVKLGSYPGTPMVVRLQGPAREVEEARAVVADHIARLDASEGGRRVRAAWSDRASHEDEEAGA